MIKHKPMLILLCMAVALTGSRNSLASCADHRFDGERPIKLYATAEAGPIGTVEALNTTINSKRAEGAQVIWNGDLLASLGAGVRVALDGVGVISLARGAMARLAITQTTRDDNSTGRILIASLISGEMRVRLAAQASAHIEVCGSAITASEGASFLVSVKADQAVLDTIKGAARIVEPAVQIDATIVSRTGNLTAMATGSSRVFEFIVTQNGQPLANRRVIFTLTGAIGSFPGGAATFVALTNAQGIVSVPFTAATAPSVGSITGTVEGTNAQTTMRIEVKKKSPLTRNMLIAAAAAGIGGIIIVTRKGPLEQEPPPAIVP